MQGKERRGGRQGGEGGRVIAYQWTTNYSSSHILTEPCVLCLPAGGVRVGGCISEVFVAMEERGVLWGGAEERCIRTRTVWEGVKEVKRSAGKE